MLCVFIQFAATPRAARLDLLCHRPEYEIAAQQKSSDSNKCRTIPPAIVVFGWNCADNDGMGNMNPPAGALLAAYQSHVRDLAAAVIDGNFGDLYHGALEVCDYSPWLKEPVLVDAILWASSTIDDGADSAANLAYWAMARDVFNYLSEAHDLKEAGR